MLKLKRIGIDMQWESVALINRGCTLFRPEEFLAMRRVLVEATGGGRLFTSLAIVDDPNIVASDELGLTESAFNRLAAEDGSPVAIAPATAPESLEAVRAKIHGATLTGDQISHVIADIAAHRYSDMEIAAFLIASASFLTTDELLHLTRSMADVGTKLDWASPMVVDKHSIGGIPGNRTSMIVVPIIAAHGLTIPKTSSRAITSPAGTADTMEVLARVDLSVQEMKDVVRECHGCLIWGGHVNLSPADEILISVERPLRIDTVEQMVASILSKKLAAGSTHLLLDIPVGPSAKVRSNTEAVRVRKLFEHIGASIGLKINAVITHADRPIGRGIGPVLEARDVMSILKRLPEAPQDLRQKALQLAGYLLEFDPELRGGAGYARAQQLLDNGEALAAMRRIIEAQGAQNGNFSLGGFKKDICAPHDGVITAIHCQHINRIARLAGAPMDKGAGIDIFKTIGARVEAGEPLYRIHACIPFDFQFAIKVAGEDCGYTITDGAAASR